MLKGIIFDLDGVLTDTSVFHYLCWKKLADELNVCYKEEFKEAFKGVSRLACVKMLLPDVTDEGELNRLANIKNDYYVEMCGTITPEMLFRGAYDLLTELKGAGVKVAIGSVSKNTELVLKKLGIFGLFDGIAGGLDIKNSKPAPDVFLVAAKKIGEEPCNCVVIEDARAGVQAAHAAGMKAIGIGTRKNLPEADMVVEGVWDLTYEKISAFQG